MKMMKPMNMGRVCTASVTKSIGGIYTIRKSSPSPESCLKQTNKQTNKNNNNKLEAGKKILRNREVKG